MIVTLPLRLNGQVVEASTVIALLMTRVPPLAPKCPPEAGEAPELLGPALMRIGPVRVAVPVVGPSSSARPEFPDPAPGLSVIVLVIITLVARLIRLQASER